MRPEGFFPRFLKVSLVMASFAVVGMLLLVGVLAALARPSIDRVFAGRAALATAGFVAFMIFVGFFLTLASTAISVSVPVPDRDAFVGKLKAGVATLGYRLEGEAARTLVFRPPRIQVLAEKVRVEMGDGVATVAAPGALLKKLERRTGLVLLPRDQASKAVNVVAGVLAFVVFFVAAGLVSLRSDLNLAGLIRRVFSSDAGSGGLLASSDGQSQLTLPRGWRKAGRTLNARAVIQAENTAEDLYVIVLRYAKGDVKGGLAEVTALTRDDIAAALTSPQLAPTLRTAINGMPAVQYEASGEENNLRVKYWMSVIEGRQGFYQVAGYGLSSRFSREKLDPLARGFHETVPATGSATPLPRAGTTPRPPRRSSR